MASTNRFLRLKVYKCTTSQKVLIPEYNKANMICMSCSHTEVFITNDKLGVAKIYIHGPSHFAKKANCVKPGYRHIY